MSQVTQQHRQSSPQQVCCAVITVSDTRTLETDRGGDQLAQLLTEAGHTIKSREIIPDDPMKMKTLVNGLVTDEQIQAILLTGGTGISGRDQTYETICDLIDKPLPGYGELFRMLSYEEIGPAAMLSRATGGLIGKTIVLTMPGSPAAIRLAMQKIILPEIGHLLREATR